MGFIADIFTANKAMKAQKDVSRDQIAASERATAQTVGLQRDIFNRIWDGTQVQRDAGDAATRMMAQIMGLNLPAQTGPGQQPGGQPQVLPQQGGGNALRNGPFGGNVVANGLAAVAGYNGGKDGMGPMLMRGSPGGLDGTDMTFRNPGAFDGGQLNLAGGGSLTSGMTGQTQAPANALTPTGNANPAQPAAPFDATAWLRSTPGYQANLDAGQRQLNHGLASRGSLFSGDAGREAMRYGSDYNDRIYGDQFNRLAAIAGAGQTATSQGGQAGQNYANQSGQAYQQNALNLGSSYQNRGNAISGFWGNVNGSINNATNAFGKMMMGGF